VFFESVGWQQVPVYIRENLAAGNKLAGPCIVEEPISTSLIPQGFGGFIDEFKNIVIKAEETHGI
jgi:N-methylhydantoinase A/oxoprolinase/acetone carboxylase beta subunit